MNNINSFTTIHQTMDDPEDVTMDTYSGYSDSEKSQNYMQLVNTLKFFEDNGHITEDWMDEHKWVIERWRDWIDNYCDINLDITEPTFRKACSDAETLISYLIKSIRTVKTFDPKVYRILLQKMKYICDNVFMGDEMGNLMNSMTLK